VVERSGKRKKAMITYGEERKVAHDKRSALEAVDEMRALACDLSRRVAALADKLCDCVAPHSTARSDEPQSGGVFPALRVGAEDAIARIHAAMSDIDRIERELP